MSFPSPLLIGFLRRGITLLLPLLGLLFLYIYLTFLIAALDEPVPELQPDSNEDSFKNRWQESCQIPR